MSAGGLWNARISSAGYRAPAGIRAKFAVEKVVLLDVVGTGCQRSSRTKAGA